MPDPLTAVAPTKSLYDMLTSRQGLSALAVAGVQTAAFLVFVWVGGWGFSRDWGTVARWIVFLVCSAMLFIAWAYHVYRDAEDRRERAATLEMHRLSQEILVARRETFASDEEFYKARKNWATERDELLEKIRQSKRDEAALRDTIVRLQERALVADWAEPRMKAAEAWFDERGKRIMTSMPGNVATVQDKPQ